ncbi:MAG: hypothetical protein K0S04_300 [Herbinix sp.]|nr:hypothetical protein [Herbinix sp.]
MNQLEQKTIISVEVADMVGKDHKELLRDIRRYSEQLAGSNIALSDFFTESTYTDANNQDRPCYLVTKKGCEFIGNKLTGVKGAVFTAKYINKFNDMEHIIAANIQNLSPELQMFQNIFNAVAQQELRNKQIEQKVDKAIETTQAIKEAVGEVYDDWRADIKHKVSAIQKGINESYQDTYNRLYSELEKRAHCDLSARVRNGRDRLIEAGVTKTKVEAFGRLDVIEADARLKEIFTAIIKEHAVKYVA